MYVQGQSPDKEGLVRFWTLPYFRSVVIAVYFSWKGGIHVLVTHSVIWIHVFMYIWLAEI